MSVFDIYIRSPVNKLSGLVSNQSGCSDGFLMPFHELVQVRDTLMKKKRRLARLMRKNGNSVQNRVVNEYSRIIQQIALFDKEIASKKHGERNISDIRKSSFTPRENEILILMAEKVSNYGISKRLGISKRSVESYVFTIKSKIGAIT